jgi:putative spermidine/putrescine transport system permease protein
MSARAATTAWSALTVVLRAAVLLFCLGPALLVIVLSFFTDALGTFPPQHFSLDLYGRLFTSPTWGRALWTSLRICLPAALLTTALTAMAVIGLERGRVRGRAALELAALAPLLVPATSFAVSVYLLYLELGWVGHLLPLILIEAVAGIPIAFLVMRGALRRIDRNIEFVAMALGAGWRRAMLDVTIRISLPALAVSFIFAFLTAFDDALYVTFLAGPDQATVSKAIFDSLRFELDPLVAPLSALMMVGVAALATLALALQGRER